ncbi:MAG: hypothetical protein ACK4FF_08015 [Limnobacter sp.]|uniref:hypothetical protein n=1 Tax=Limnobacter sp. TaxID=2003368 RepID=UPI00391D1045
MRRIPHRLASLLLIALLAGPAFAGNEPTVGPAVGKALKSAVEQLGGKQYSAASAGLMAALQAESLTAFERFSLNRLLVGAALGDKQYAVAVKSAREVLGSAFLNEQERGTVQQSLLAALMKQGQFQELAQACTQFLERNPADVSLLELRLKANYLGKQYTQAIQSALPLLNVLERQQATPSEEMLKLLAASASEATDWAMYQNALRKLVKHYPNAEYWSDLLYRSQADGAFKAVGDLQFYRLLRATRSYRDSGEFIDAADAAIKAGYPLEAAQFLDLGVAMGLLPHADVKDAYADRRKQVEKLLALEAKQPSGKAKSPLAMVANGYNEVLAGRVDAGLKSMSEGVAVGVPSVVRVNYAVAQAMVGQHEQARAEMARLLTDAQCGKLAELWLLALRP